MIQYAGYGNLVDNLYTRKLRENSKENMQADNILFSVTRRNTTGGET